MKKITLLMAFLGSVFSFAQTTHNLDWQQGISGEDASLTIEVGDIVIWTLTNTSPHTVTSLDGSQETFDSGTLSGMGETFSFTFTEVGENDYQCNFHAGNMFGTITVEEAIEPVTIAIPDSNFEQKLIDLGIDSNGLNGNILETDTEGIINLNLISSNISSLEGIEGFEDLEQLLASFNDLENIDVSSNSALQNLILDNNNLSQLDVTQNSNLVEIVLTNNNVENINLVNNPNLEYIRLSGNKISSFDATMFSQLILLDLEDMQTDFLLTSVNTTDLTNLKYLSLGSNELETLDVSTNLALERLVLNSSPLLNSIDLSSNLMLFDFYAMNSNFSLFDFSENSSLGFVFVNGNANLTSLNLKNGNNSTLGTLEATDNPSLDCIQVDEATIGNIPSGWSKDDTAVYNTDCEAFLAVENINAETEISIYPNPVAEVLNVKLANNSEINSIQIFDLTGKLVLSQVGTTPQMDVSSINAGVYFVKISSNEFTSVKKMIKE